MFKKLLALLLCLCLVLAFAGCKKDDAESSKPADPSSNVDTTVDDTPTQDYDNSEFDEGEGLTPEEKEELEDLWNDYLQNGEVEIVNPETGDSVETTPDSDTDTSSSNSSSSESNNTDNGMGDSDVQIGASQPSIW